ncbi:MAG: glycosyltransferase family 39 protein [Candidatus Aureabacteria bacterium]|nr:glycosyltransferase family 39 protein [Candidatus Auribacterota bacterium]
MESIRFFILEKRGRWGADVLILSLFFAFAFFQCLGEYPLMDPDEGRYAEVPREMLESGGFVTPHLNYVHFFFKPPLFYWMNVISLKAFGESEFAVRFPSALCGFLVLVLTYFIGWKVFGRRAALLSAVILGTSGGYYTCSRLNLIDMPLTLCVTAALGFFLLASIETERHRGFYFHFFYIFMALAVLIKGLIGIILPGMVIFFYMLLMRRWRLLREMRLLAGALIVIGICAPWFILVSVKNPGFMKFFFLREHVGRFISQIHQRHEFFGFFVPALLGMMFPWSFFLPAAVARFWSARKSDDYAAWLFLVLWALVILIFFSFSESALLTYILPIFPAVALLTGATLSAAFDRWSGWIRWPSLIIALVFCVGGAGVIIYPHLARITEVTPGMWIAPGIIGIVGGVLSFRFTRRANAAGLFFTLCVMLYLIQVIAAKVIPTVFLAERTTKKLALIAREKVGSDTLIASYMYQPSLAFYTHRKFVMVDADSTIDLDPSRGPGGDTSLFLDINQFIQAWDSGKPIIVLLKERDLASLREKVKAPAVVLGQQGDKILATNR